MVSSKVPHELVAVLNGLMSKALASPEVRTAYAQQGMMALGGTTDEAAAYIAQETETWKKVVADAGIRFE